MNLKQKKEEKVKGNRKKNTRTIGMYQMIEGKEVRVLNKEMLVEDIPLLEIPIIQPEEEETPKIPHVKEKGVTTERHPHVDMIEM
jgi:hypothetical protein